MARYKNARTQMTSNFAPIKRLTLERKSPVVSTKVSYLLRVVATVSSHERTSPLFVPFGLSTEQTRLDINAPYFEAYHKTLPGLFPAKPSSS